VDLQFFDFSKSLLFIYNNMNALVLCFAFHSIKIKTNAYVICLRLPVDHARLHLERIALSVVRRAL
jgi:hypothetical protein